MWRQFDGIPASISPTKRMDQRVKTATAVRAIRLHSTLLLLGFIKFVQKRRRHSGSQLFD